MAIMVTSVEGWIEAHFFFFCGRLMRILCVLIEVKVILVANLVRQVPGVEIHYWTRQVSCSKAA